MPIAALSSSRTSTRTSWLASLALVAAMLLVPAVAAPAQAAIDPCGPAGQQDLLREQQAGHPPAEWDDFDGAGDDDIQGFATDISVNVGQRIDFKIDTNASAYTIDIYRIGYYDGDGARKITSVTPSATLPQNQPNCITDVATELYDCGNWAVSASWNVPTTAVSGVYIARLHRADRDGSSHITFIVRDDASHVRRGLPDLRHRRGRPTTPTAARTSTRARANGRAYKVSYNRPVLTRGRRATAATSSSPTSTRWSASSSATGTTSATSRASTPTAAATCCSTTRRSCRSVTTSTGAGSSAPTSRRPVTPAST